MRLRPLLVWALAAGVAQAQLELLHELSFGYDARINPEGSHSIPHFQLQGNPNLPELLSNKVILTPPAPGNQRGSVWTEKTLDHDDWIVEITFRVNGPERSGGNINVWLVRDGEREVGSSSIYTVGRFEGLALVLDTYSGSAGMIRGFLNDGATDYKSAAVDGLSFAHCNYAYRNLGRPSTLKLVQTDSIFKVEVDGTSCFSSDRVQIPPGYRLGVSAASAENPDSVEVFKLAVLREKHDAHQGNSGQHQHQTQQNKQGSDSSKKTTKPPGRFDRERAPVSGRHNEGDGGSHNWDEEYEQEDIADEDASHYVTSKAQFEDMHNRLQSVNHHLSTIFRQIAQQGSIGEKRHEETSAMIHEVKNALAKLGDLDNRMQNLEREMRTIRTDLSHKVQATENNIKSMVGDTHVNLAKKVEDHAASGHGRLIFVIVGSQVILVAAYLVYKRRKSSMPKKYL